MSRIRVLCTLAALAVVSLPAGGARATPSAADPLADLVRATGGQIDMHVEPATGSYSFVRATGSAPLDADDATRDPEARARTFLARYGSVAGLEPGTDLRLRAVRTDVAGNSHVRLRQFHDGVAVFAAEIVVHMDERGITAFNGQLVPAAELGTSPAITRAAAVAAALRVIPDAEAPRASLVVFRPGLVEGYEAATRLAWLVEAAGEQASARILVDALAGDVLASYGLHEHAKDRCVYTPRFDPENPDLFAVRREGSLPTFVPPIDNLYDFTGEVYDLFAGAFGFDSYNDAGATMRTVYLVNEICPNAYWNGSTTNYCPGFDTDDIVAHEWGHAYTDGTSDLVYAYEPGALNESYSDIWGETLDLINGRDALGGSNNDEPFPAGVRWLVGEDLTLNDRVQRALGLRDMWSPERMGMPGRLRAGQYTCGEGDNGGVHHNSSVSNHAYAMLVDGKTYNNVTVAPIGMTKAAHAHWQTQHAYLTPASKFADHAAGLLASCNDLLGVDLNDLSSGAPSGQALGTSDCDQIANAVTATQMADGVRCRFTPILRPGAPALCSDPQVVYSENFESGLGGVVAGHEGRWPTSHTFDWEAASALPQGRAGTAAFAPDRRGVGSCDSYVVDDASGRYWIETPPITAVSGSMRMRFDHFVETQRGADGGNLLISVDGGDYTVIPQSVYDFNAPNTQLLSVVDSTNPKAGQFAWTGNDPGSTTGSWGTTVVDLFAVVDPGQSFRVRFDFGVDRCGGDVGWFVDDVLVYVCPPATPASDD